MKHFIEHSSKVSGKISPSGVEFSREELETKAGQVSASLTAATYTKEALPQNGNLPASQNSLQEIKQYMSTDKVLEIGYKVGQALNPQITEQLSKTSILWVEDKSEDNTFEKDALKTLGINVGTISSLEEAMEKIKISKFDIIIYSLKNISKPYIQATIAEIFIDSIIIIYNIGLKSRISAIEEDDIIGFASEPIGLFQLVVNAVKRNYAPILKREHG